MVNQTKCGQIKLINFKAHQQHYGQKAITLKFIHHIMTESEQLQKRLIRTLKNKIYKYFTFIYKKIKPNNTTQGAIKISVMKKLLNLFIIKNYKRLNILCLKIKKRKTKKGDKVDVKWKGYAYLFNSWIYDSFMLQMLSYKN